MAKSIAFAAEASRLSRFITSRAASLDRVSRSITAFKLSVSDLHQIRGPRDMET